MPQALAPSVLQEPIETITNVLETVGSSELGRRAGVPEATIRDMKKKGFRPRSVQTLDALHCAALKLKAELAER